MENRGIIQLLKLTCSLLELHEENPFKINSIRNASIRLENMAGNLSTMSLPELESAEGISKSIAAKIYEIITTGKLAELETLLTKTPAGVLEMLQIKGLGPKKIRTLWKELDILNKEALLAACQENKVAALKGFGEKTQQNIKEALVFVETHKEQFLYAEAEELALKIEEVVKKITGPEKTSLAGEIRRKLGIVETIQVLVASDHPAEIMNAIDSIDFLQKDHAHSGPFVWRGRDTLIGIKTEIKIFSEKEYGSQLYLYSSAREHLLLDAKEGQTFFHFLNKNKLSSEKEIFDNLELPFIEPELREGYDEAELARANKLPRLVTWKDLKGTLHNHSTYSDGRNSLEEMALYCKELGFEYLGISDHSKTAFYANGLDEKRIVQQHKEIDELNRRLAPFRIFKGIESDILNDGSLDYADEVLDSFDFIVASIHSNLKMTEEKATQRLITAIENPYTTILGHATGRLLLKREGYPIHHKKIIDACAANNVIIEINANPRRLDMDWRWIRYALEKNIMISINPDAHEKGGYMDMQYGVYMGRKAGLTSVMTFNALPLAEAEKHFFNKKKTLQKT